MRNTQRSELAVCGLESVRALAEQRPQSVRRFFYAEERARDFGRLCSTLAAAKRPYRLVSADELRKLSGTEHHQGVVAMIEDTPLTVVSDALVQSWAESGAGVVVLDRVGDDHNLGAIARAAAFFGWSAIVVARDDGAARLTTSAFRVARGALERIPVYRDETAARFVRRCHPAIMTIGADHRGTNTVRELSLEPRSIAVVLGNEETGLSPAVREACDRLVRITGAGAVESLNVSQAAAVFLYELCPHRGGGAR